MKYKELSNRTEADLQKELKTLREKVVELRVKVKLGQAKNIHELTAVRKDIARILTYLRAN
jgi:ribosomal protein L29